MMCWELSRCWETAVNTRSKDLPSWRLCFGGLSGKGKAAVIFANLLTWTLGRLKGYPLLTPPPASPASSLCSPEVLVSNSWHGYSISPQMLASSWLTLASPKLHPPKEQLELAPGGCPQLTMASVHRQVPPEVPRQVP